jgi:hypothetical protein
MKNLLTLVTSIAIATSGSVACSDDSGQVAPGSSADNSGTVSSTTTGAATEAGSVTNTTTGAAMGVTNTTSTTGAGATTGTTTGTTTGATASGATAANPVTTGGSATSGSMTTAATTTSGTATAGAGGASTSGATSATGGLPADVLFSDDFESGVVGQQPSGWDNFIAWNANGANPSGEDLALVDNAQAHGGAQSLHFHGGSNPAQLTRVLPDGTDRLYIRAYVRMSRQLGNVPATDNPNHETLIAIRGTPGGASDEVRFGEIKGAIGTNEVPSDNIAPTMDLWNSGPSVPADTWACIEVAFLGDRDTHELHAWVDGSEVHTITDPATQFQNGAMPANWLEGNFVELVIGWHSFSSATADVWMDDLVVALSPIGC